MIGFDLSPRAADAAPRRADPLAAYFAPAGGRHVALAAGPQGGLHIWSEIGAGHAACLRLDGAMGAQRWSWRETLVARLHKIYPAGAFVLAGSWGQLQSSGSGLAGSYTGNRAVSSASTTASITVQVARETPYDLWVYYTGRSSGGYCRVDIDGDQTLVDALDDPAGLGFRAFSTYHSVDMQRRLSVKVASNLVGAHQITLRPAGPATPGGSNVVIEALGLSADLRDAGILPPPWRANTAHVMGDEVQHSGLFYAARASGISGSTPPSHVSGIGSDGALDWRADNRPSYPQLQVIDYASEREYAARVTLGGVGHEIGGQTHGHDLLQARQIMLDDAPWPPLGAPNAAGLHVGQRLTIAETTRWSDPAGQALATCQMTRQISAGQIAHDLRLQVDDAAPLTLEWLYLAMLPFVHWDGESGALIFDQIAFADGTAVALADFAGQIPPNIDCGALRRAGLRGAALGGQLRYALAVDRGTLPAQGGFLRPNLDGRQAAGSLDWMAKLYATGHDAGVGLHLAAGAVMRWSSRHHLAWQGAVNP